MEYIRGNAHQVAEDGYFSAFISNGVSTELCFLVFALITLVIIYAGVRNGIERVSKFMMPILVVLSVIIAAYSVTRPGAIEGVKYLIRKIQEKELQTITVNYRMRVIEGNTVFNKLRYTYL